MEPQILNPLTLPLDGVRLIEAPPAPARRLPLLACTCDCCLGMAAQRRVGSSKYWW
nr:hypothetical protein [Salinivibrio costicola]